MAAEFDGLFVVRAFGGGPSTPTVELSFTLEVMVVSGVRSCEEVLLYNWFLSSINQVTLMVSAWVLGCLIFTSR